MSYKLRLVKGEDVLVEVPLSLDYWSDEEIIQELRKSRIDSQRFGDLWGILANRRRVRMITHLLHEQNHTASFKDLQDYLNLNPKSIREHAMRLHKSGLLSFPRRGRYHLKIGNSLRLIILNLAFRRILHHFSEENEI